MKRWKRCVVWLWLLACSFAPVYAGDDEIEEDSSGYVLLGPFVDDDDYSTLKTGSDLTITQSDVMVSKNGAASAQKNDASNCTYDTNGMFRCPFDATDSSTTGRLTFTVKMADTLVVKNGFKVRASNAHDSLIDGTDKLDTNAAEISGDSTAADNAELLFDNTGFTASNSTIGTATSVGTVTGNVDGNVGGNVTGTVGGFTAGAQAEIEAEATDALEADGLDHLVSASVAGADVADDSIIAQMVSKSATADWDSYNNTTEAHEALRDIIGTPAGTLASDIYAVGEDVSDILGDTNELQTNQGDWATATGFMPNTEDGTSFDAIPWNPDWDAEVESEVNEGLIVLNLDHLCKTATGGADMTTEVADNTILSRVLANGDTSAFDPSTDGFQPIRDRGDAAWITATGFMPDTEDGSSFDSIPWNSSWDAEVESEVYDELVQQHLDHLFAQVYDPASKPGNATALLNELVENDGGVSRYTENALEQAPTGGATAVEVRTEMDSNSTQFAAIVADTNELQTNQGDWATATGFSTHSDADVWAVGDRQLTAFSFTPDANMVQISGDTTAANNLEAILDGTGAVLTLSQLRIDSSAAGGAIDIDNDTGPGVSIASSAAEGLYVTTTGASQHAVYFKAGVGTGGDAFRLAGDTDGVGFHPMGGSGAGDGIRAVGGSTGDDIQGDITGNLSGSVGSVTAGVTLANDAITSAKYDESTAYPLVSADSGATEVARVGADGDTLETLSDQIDGTSTHTAVNVRTEMDSNSTQFAAIVGDTNMLQTDWVNDGRLDAILDLILADTGELQTNQGDWATAVGFSTHSAVNVRTEMDSNSTQLSAIVGDTNELQGNQANWATATSVDLNADAITASVFDETTAYPLESADSDATQVARVGADSDTLETLSDQIDLTMLASEDGSSFDSIPWNGDWDTEVESEANDALVGQNLDHLLKASATLATDMHLDSAFGQMLDAGGTLTYDRSTDALEVLGAAAGTTDWTSTERQHIRYRIGVDGSTAAPTNVPHLEVVDADVKQIDDSTTAVSVIKNYYTAGVTQGSVSDAEPTATEFDTTLTAAGNDYYNNAFIVFIDGDLTGQVRKIRDYTAGTPSTITVGTAFTVAPGGGDNFLILGRSE